MKTVSAAMNALRALRMWYTAKLFTFTLVDGTVFNFCSGDIDLTVSATIYSSGGTTGPFFEKADKKAKTHRAIGTTVDQMIFDVIPGAWAPEGLPFAFAVRVGLFDGADFTYQRVIMGTPGDTSAGAVLMFSGRVANIDFSNSAAQFTIDSYLTLLDIQFPRDVFQAGCLNTLFDTSCTLSPASFSFAGAITGAPTASVFTFSGAATGKGAGYYNLGKIQFTSGKNSSAAPNGGPFRAIQNHTTGPETLTVFPQFGYVPAVGDTFTAYAGCDKQQSTCTTKFSNKPNFRGMPYVPQVETGL